MWYTIFWLGFRRVVWFDTLFSGCSYLNTSSTRRGCIAWDSWSYRKTTTLTIIVLVVLQALGASLQDIYRLLKQVEATDSDQATKLHAQNALCELDVIMREFLFPKPSFTRQIRFLPWRLSRKLENSGIYKRHSQGQAVPESGIRYMSRQKAGCVTWRGRAQSIPPFATAARAWTTDRQTAGPLAAGLIVYTMIRWSDVRDNRHSRDCKLLLLFCRNRERILARATAERGRRPSGVLTLAARRGCRLKMERRFTVSQLLTFNFITELHSVGCYTPWPSS